MSSTPAPSLPPPNDKAKLPIADAMQHAHSRAKRENAPMTVWLVSSTMYGHDPRPGCAVRSADQGHPKWCAEAVIYTTVDPPRMAWSGGLPPKPDDAGAYYAAQDERARDLRRRIAEAKSRNAPASEIQRLEEELEQASYVGD